MPKARLLLRMLPVLRMSWLEAAAEKSCRLRRSSLKVRLPEAVRSSHGFGLKQQPPSDKELHEQPAGLGQQTVVVTAAAAGDLCGKQCLEQTAGSLGPELSHLQAAVCSGSAWCDDSGEEFGGDGDSECSENKTKKMGTKRGREEIENEIEPDETGSLEADRGSQPTKRAKMDPMPLKNVYEQQRLENMRQIKEALPLPNFRLPWRLALLQPVLRTRPRYRCAAWLQVLDAQKVGEAHANMQALATKAAAPRARAPKEPSNGLPTRRSGRLLQIPAGPSFIDNEHEDGSVIICTVRVQSATSGGPPLPLGRNCAACSRLA
jgi:hypothetical protein